VSSKVQRFTVKAHPTDQHPAYYRWQTATVCVFVGEDDRAVALDIARKLISDHHWVVIEFLDKATLIEERVRSAGGEVWQAYQEALRGKMRLVEIIDQPTTSKDGSLPMLAPKMTETFIDSVVVEAGGHRFVPTGKRHALPQNADYLIDNYVFDLKTLEVDSLEINATQEKLGRLFGAAFPGKTSISLDPSLLSEADQKEYFDIVRKRLQKLIRHASSQVRATKAQIGNASLKGGVILLNSGFGSLPSSVFEEQAERCVQNDSTQIDCVICISVWLMTNGFDSTINCKFYPFPSQNPTVERLAKAFFKREEEWMTAFARTGFLPQEEATQPMKPVAFERNGIIFSFVPPQIPDKRFPG
jgi:hypothetical protein